MFMRLATLDISGGHQTLRIQQRNQIASGNWNACWSRSRCLRSPRHNDDNTARRVRVEVAYTGYSEEAHENNSRYSSDC